MSVSFIALDLRVIIMKRTWKIPALIFVIAVIGLMALLVGCKLKEQGGAQQSLFNESLNQQIENLTNSTNSTATLPAFQEFYFNYTSRNDSKYEIARDDIFSLTNGSFNSSQISFLGVMLGDSFESVIARLGQPDMMGISADNSIMNLDYRERIGIGGTDPALTIHIDNNTVTRVTIKPPFNKYLHGNTTINVSKEVIYNLLDEPDYQNFMDYLRIFHYVSKGMELYFKNVYVERMSFIPAKTFKGVVYVTMPQLTKEGIIANVTEPVEIQ